MTLNNFINVISNYNIPMNVTIKSDSGWECCATDIQDVWYSREYNELVFTSEFNSDKYLNNSEWIHLIKE